MWEEIGRHFTKFPSQGKVARLMLRNGLRISGRKILSDQVELSDTAIGRALGVDRRVVRDTVKTIKGNKELRSIFSRLYPTCSLKSVASTLGWNVIEIIPDRAQTPGIIYSVSAIFAKRDINIRQIMVEDDPAHSQGPRGYIITERSIPPEIILRIKDVPGVAGVVFH